MYLGRRVAQSPVLKQIGRKASYRKVASYPRSWKRRLLSPPSYSNGRSSCSGLETRVGSSVLSFHWFQLSSSTPATTSSIILNYQYYHSIGSNWTASQ